MMNPAPPYFKKMSWRMAAGGIVVLLIALIVIAATGGFFADDAPPVPGQLTFSIKGWRTDFTKHTIPLEDIRGAGPGKDGIPRLDRPIFVSVDRANRWMENHNPVIALELDGDARAYPLQILNWHEIVNDIVGGTPVTITFCPLCNSAVAFPRTLDGVIYDFGVTGNLYNSDLVMWDCQTQSWWQQITGEAIVGELAGKQLTFIPAPIVAWADFMDSNPKGLILSLDTGFDRNYASNPYNGYDRLDRPPTNFAGEYDRRLQPKERVAAVTVGGVDLAFPFSTLEQERVVNYSDGQQDIVVLFKPGTVSALGRVLIYDSKDVGSTGVFKADIDGRRLTFRLQGEEFVDDQTGSVWNIFGEATNGPLAGSQLTPIVHGNHFWFAWGAFKPNTLIYQGAT